MAESILIDTDVHWYTFFKFVYYCSLQIMFTLKYIFILCAVPWTDISQWRTPRSFLLYEITPLTLWHSSDSHDMHTSRNKGTCCVPNYVISSSNGGGSICWRLAQGKLQATWVTNECLLTHYALPLLAWSMWYKVICDTCKMKDSCLDSKVHVANMGPILAPWTLLSGCFHSVSQNE